MSTDRFLITGALGCIGAWTVRNLVREGIPTVVFELGSDPYRLKLIMTPDELAQVTFVHDDITDLTALEQALDKHTITHVIHLAALQLPFVKANPSLGAQINVVGTVNVFEAVARRKERIDRFTYASSVAIYDAAEVGESGAVIQHTMTGHPTSLYGVFKQANEGTARIYWQDNHIASIGLRPVTVYGAGCDQGITRHRRRRCWPPPAASRSIFPMEDVVNSSMPMMWQKPSSPALARLLRVPRYSTCMAAWLPWGELVEVIETVAPESRGQITFDEPGFPSPDEFDADALSKLLGPLPHTPLQDGVAATVALFRERITSGLMAADTLFPARTLCL